MEVGRLDVGLRKRLKNEKRIGPRALMSAHVSQEDSVKLWGQAEAERPVWRP